MLFKILRGDESRISLDTTPFHEGWAYVTRNGNYYVDMNIGTIEEPNNQRIKLNAANAETLCGMTLEELREEFTAQNAEILHEAQLYADEAIANINVTYEINSAGVLCPSTNNDSWIGMLGASLLINQAQSATQNDTLLEVF